MSSPISVQSFSLTNTLSALFPVSMGTGYYNNTGIVLNSGAVSIIDTGKMPSSYASELSSFVNSGGNLYANPYSLIDTARGGKSFVNVTDTSGNNYTFLYAFHGNSWILRQTSGDNHWVAVAHIKRDNWQGESQGFSQSTKYSLNWGTGPNANIPWYYLLQNNNYYNNASNIITYPLNSGLSCSPISTGYIANSPLEIDFSYNNSTQFTQPSRWFVGSPLPSGLILENYAPGGAGLYNNARIIGNPQNTGVWNILLGVQDSSGNTIASNTVIINVNTVNLLAPPPVFSLSPFSFPVTSQINTRVNLTKNTQKFPSNTSWTFDSGTFTGYGLGALYTGDAGLIVSNYGRQGDAYHVKYGVQPSITGGNNTGVYRTSVSLNRLKTNTAVAYQNINSVNSAWVSYNMNSGSGMTNGTTNVFSYAFEFINKLGLSYPLLTNSTNTGYIPITGVPPVLTSYISNLLSGINCVSSVDCSFPSPNICPSFPPFCNFTDVVACWTGNSTTGSDYTSFYNSFLNSTLSGSAWGGLYSNTYSLQKDKSTIAAITAHASADPVTSGMFNYITGSIQCYPFLSGDSLTFNLYGFDYTGLYQSYHNSFPIYPTTGFTLNCPTDFTGASDLASTLNSRLNTSYPVWYPYANLSGTPVGLYFTGSLMSFVLDTSNTQAPVPVINFVSNRNYTSGFNLSLNLAARTGFKVLDQSMVNASINQISGYSFLIPDKVQLQGLSGTQWIVLDSQTGLYSQLTGLSPIEVDITGWSGWLNNNQPYIPAVISGSAPSLPYTPMVSQPIQTGGFKILYSGTQTAYAQKNGLCPILSDTRSITIQEPTGWPSGMIITGCVPPTGANGQNCDICCQWAAQNNFSGYTLYPTELLGSINCNQNWIPYVQVGNETCWICSGTVANSTTVAPIVTKMQYLRTGWNLNPTGYLNCLINNTTPAYDVTKLSFNEYRLVFSNFSGQPIISDDALHYLPQSGFIFKNINLFSAINSPVTGNSIETGVPFSQFIGSPYTLQIMGTAAIPFNYNYSYTISGQGQSGIYNAFNEGAFYTPTGSQVNATFVNSSGVIVGQVTGFVSGLFTGSGIITKDFSNYFYDPNTNQVTFDKIITGFVVQSGVLSTTANILTSSTVASQIVAGGALSNQSYFTYVITGGVNNVTGYINKTYQKDNVTGFYLISGNITGNSTYGVYTYNKNVSGQYTGGASSNKPYYITPTGFVNAFSAIPINFSILNEYDYLAINNNPLSYSKILSSVGYFSGISDIVTTINASPNTYLVSGLDMRDPSISGSYNAQTGIVLYSLISGASGNGILLSSSNTGIAIPSGTSSLTGGVDQFSLMFNSNWFTGVANGSLYRTGFYTGSVPTGIISGQINAYQYTRNLSNTWGLGSGFPGAIYSYGCGNMNPLGYSGIISGDPNLGIYENLVQVYINYYNAYGTTTGAAPDVVDLYVTGYNFPSGTGFVFRITGGK